MSIIAPRHKIIIRYKSGQEQIVRTDDFKVERNTFNGALSITWGATTQPVPMFMGVDDIESIWQVS